MRDFSEIKIGGKNLDKNELFKTAKGLSSSCR
jgi:hypothetical protein